MLQNISVVICAYTEKRWDLLLDAVESIQKQSLPPQEIIIVIDHDPNLYKRASENINHVTVLENSEARGLSGARNSGIAAARGELIAFMDEDALADPAWLENLGKAYNDPSVMGVGGVILSLWHNNGKPAWFPEEFNWVVGCSYRGHTEKSAPVRNLIGCNMSFRKDVFESVGGFRSGIGRIGSLPYGCEETELCIRAGQQFPTKRFMYEPLARVYHRVPEQRTRFRYFLSRCYAEGISKALIAHLVGGQDGLSSERTYTFKTLPEGIGCGICDAIRDRDFSGFGRATAIVVGFSVTVLGYLVGKLILIIR